MRAPPPSAASALARALRVTLPVRLLEKRARIYLVPVKYTGLPVARLKRELQPPVEVT